MDFGKLDVSKKADEGAWLTICDLDGVETDAKIKVAGIDSKVFKRRMNKIMDAQRKKKNGLNSAEAEREMIETYATCTLDLENCFIGKKEIKAENVGDVIDFYKEYRFVLDQVVEFSGERSNFLPS
jgi:Cu/Ag efflux pump CusA